MNKKDSAENKKKNPNDASTYSADAFLTNPVASVQDHTGMTQHVPEDGLEAQAYADMLDVPSSGRDGSKRHSEVR